MHPEPEEPPSRVPTLVLWGALDAPDSARARAYARAFPHSQKIVFADAPHPCYLRDVAAAKEFTALIVEFVTGDRAAGPGLDVHAAW